MNGQSRGRRGKWLRLALAISVAVAVHALGGGSAQAASMDFRSLATGSMATAGGSTGSDTLAGVSSQHYPVFFKVSNDGKALLADGIAISMNCVSGGTLVWPDTFGRIPVHPDGKVHANYASPTVLTNGVATTVKDVMTARLSPNHSRLTGTWHLSVSFSFPDGTSDQCDSGPVAFSATS